MSVVPLKTTVIRLIASVMIGLGPMIVFAEQTSHIGNLSWRALGLAMTVVGIAIVLLNPRMPRVNPPAPHPDAGQNSN